MQKILIPALALLLASCGGNSGSSSSSSSSSASSSSSSSSSSTSSSSSGNPVPVVTVQENQTGFCYAEGTVDNNNLGFTGDGFVNTTNAIGARVAWRINAQQLGSYSLSLVYANGASAARGGTLFVNEANNGVVTLDVTNGWTDWQSESIQVSLDEGENTIILSATTDGGLANIDALQITGEGITPVVCPLTPGSSGSSSSSSSSSSASSSGSGICNPQFMVGGLCYEPYFAGINTGSINLGKYVNNAATYRQLVLNNVSHLKNPMWSIQQTGQWSIYFHIEEWQGPVTALAITNMTNEYERLANEWMDTLDAFDSSAPKQVDVKVFGFVFNEGVTPDDSFYSTYGDYPIVTNWTQADERSPWVVASKANGSVSNQNWYNIVDFTTLQVIGNRNDAGGGVNYSPANWNGYVHPEGVDMFFTKFWLKIPWDAVAQRQYLKLGGNVLNYATGQLDAHVFAHEMGHCFFHDDFYSNEKYPDNGGMAQESVMHGAHTIQNFDRVIQRMIWETQRP